jgi:CMP-N-acetylneuraminic acid synthetase
MKQGKTIVAFVPARLGSERVKFKNLRMLGGHPLIYYIIQAVKEANSFDRVFVNSESDLIGEVAKRYGVEFYKRPDDLATSSSRFDDYINDFLVNVPCDVLAIINPTSPFLTSEDIDRAVDQFLASDCDTQLSCEAVQTHCFYKGEALNFSIDRKHPRSQDLDPVLACNYAVAIWDAKKFLANYEANGHGVYTGKLGFFVIEGWGAIDIDYSEDFALAEVVMEHRREIEEARPKYDPVLDELLEREKPDES